MSAFAIFAVVLTFAYAIYYAVVIFLDMTRTEGQKSELENIDIPGMASKVPDEPPTEYIQYLYKTARKHWASVGVVTQDIQDITGNKIVKDAIISRSALPLRLSKNSGVFVLLDQSKFKEKFKKVEKFNVLC